MNARIYLDGDELTDRCMLEQTRISYDSNRNITTAEVTLLGPKWGTSTLAVYDGAYYDQDYYAERIEELAIVQILDGRDNSSKLFEGQIYAIDLKQTDAPPANEVLYVLTLNDYSAWLDRAVAWNAGGVTFPASDQQIIQSLVAAYCPKIDTSNVQSIMPNITGYDYQGKTLRQILDDMVGLSAGQWRMDFSKKLYYNPVGNAPLAPFDLSTSPDNTTSFPVRVDEYKRDFSNPVNHCYVYGAVDASSGVPIAADYSDPVSIQKYGEFQFGIYSAQITSYADAVLRATTEVMQYGYPLETGTFTIWKDGLALGQQVNLHEDWLGIDGAFIIRALNFAWKDQSTVEYKVTFGAARPSLERYLRLIDQIMRWQSMKPAVATVAPGSITDASIAVPPGLSASVIGSVNAQSIIGQISSGQIGSVNAGAVIGQLAASQIGSVNAPTIQGSITAAQVGSINAAVIQGVVVSSQLADGIIDSLSKYAAALQPVAMLAGMPTLPNKNNPPNSYFFNRADGNFYLVSADGASAASQGSDPNTVTGKMEFYNVGAINAKDIIGLVLAAQIQSITAGQITGQIQAAQIGGVNASNILGTIAANQIGAVNASVIQGTIQANQIAAVNAATITGTIQGSQIANINAATITIGLLADNQIGSVNATKLMVGGVNAYTITVTDSGGSNVIGRIGQMTGGNYGGWFKTFGAGGNDYTSAPLYTDVSGNLFIKNAALSITSGSCTISTSTTTYDPSYSTLALENICGPDAAYLISRGMVFYYNNSKIGSLVRSPSGGYLELECTVGGSYVLISGALGVRSDAGYKIGGSLIVNSSLQASFAFVTATSGVNVGSSGSYQVNGVQAINYLAQFVGAGVNCNAGIAGTGFNIYGGGTGQSATFQFRGGDGNRYQVSFTGGILTAGPTYIGP